MIVFVLLPVKSSRSPFGILAQVLLLFTIYDCKNVRWMPYIFLFWWFFLNHETSQESIEFLFNKTSIKKLRQSRRLQNGIIVCNWQKSSKLRVRKIEQAYFFYANLVKQRVEWLLFSMFFLDVETFQAQIYGLHSWSMKQSQYLHTM